MFESSTQLQCCAAYLRSTASDRHSNSSSDPVKTASRRLLIVESRDEVFATLKRVLEEQACEVARAVRGTEVAHRTEQFAPDLLLINENMPDESGWLISCKLRLTRVHKPVWLYAVRPPQFLADWKNICGVDEVIAYRGAVNQLTAQIRQRLKNWLQSSANDRQRGRAALTANSPAAA